ncbi:MAG: hypothetical protein A2909_03255 [Candidatus Tagabacteria bacterium RIFCSPLOWO2_01_FULL_39_11]|uniref:NYN domain-containing protein n=1 Tax=Candidatus Tagabacteria bacterium RIFCSPLOWO2_01_FULL_39_11 TaxID=1802295 RepID=A0A1G2LT07_9BACT|nr:MAG: hypothetical protein A2909_03255 [Candidatus Tagabacteria bacterium RIFCSPLOWO2_01_FULL_39_11]
MSDRPKLGLYINGANLFYAGKRNGFMIDYKKLHAWVSKESDIVVAKYFIGQPSWEPAKSLNKTFNKYLEKIGYTIVTKPLKKLKTKDGIVKNKCNFDVEMHDEIIHDLDKLDMVYLVSGDSDFMRTKERTLSKKKKIKFLAYKKWYSWEIRMSWHILLDDIREHIQRD